MIRLSFPVRAWAAVIIISALAVLSAIGGGMLAWISEADAEAINTAGSIRMATYRINYQLVTNFADPYPFATDQSQPLAAQVSDSIVDYFADDMQIRLDKLSHYQHNSTNKDDDIDAALSQIEQQWQQILLPELMARNQADFYQNSIVFINDVDKLVSTLQHRNEQRQNWQQVLQTFSLLLTIIIMLAGMYELQQNVLVPVQQLIEANSRFKHGKRDTRVNISGYSEFNELGDSFNDMAKTIEQHQNSLEEEVRQKTAHLTTANQALTLLYDFAKHLTTTPVTLQGLHNLVENFSKILPSLDITLCIQQEMLQDKDSIALHSNHMQDLCSKMTCDSCVIKQSEYTRSYPVMYQEQLFGELRVRPKASLIGDKHTSLDESVQLVEIPSAKSGKQASNSKRINMVEQDSHQIIAENDELMIALTNLICTALSLRKHRQQEHQLILLEERTSIARELHDSLAQSLSYLKIQISMLERQLQQNSVSSEQLNEPLGATGQTINQIKTGLNSAYQQLRELLVTFRLTINNDSFDEALLDAANEFAQKGDFAIQVHNRVMTLNLSASEQVDLIQIAREALSNISRHAQATQVCIELGYTKEDNHIVMRISDDGVGMPDDEVDQTQHHGLMIMKERASNLGGKLHVHANHPHGTVISAEFVPQFFINQDEYADINLMS